MRVFLALYMKNTTISCGFDALIIAGEEKTHDSSIVDGMVPDVFVYPPETFAADYDPEEFVQVWDGKIVLDEHGIAGRLKTKILDYIEQLPKKTAGEIAQEVEWCEKMLLRTMREDVEGYYRWHRVLYDSLEIYFDVKGLHYYGPKKALRLMGKSDAEAFGLYAKALRELDRESLSAWIDYFKSMVNIRTNGALER